MVFQICRDDVGHSFQVVIIDHGSNGLAAQV